jgi:hypothetical protein
MSFGDSVKRKPDDVSASSGLKTNQPILGLILLSQKQSVLE